MVLKLFYSYFEFQESGNRHFWKANANVLRFIENA